MAFAVPKDYSRPRSRSPIRPKSAGPKARGQSPPQPVDRPRSPSWKAPTPKQNSTLRKSLSGKGDVGNEVVMRIFEMLHETTGGGKAKHNRSGGKSARSNLRKLGTGPSEKILKNQMWKEFFSSAENSNNNSYISDAKAKPSQQNDEPKHNIREESDNHNNDILPNEELDYQKLYYKLVKRINQLWKELKIPLSDRDFYSVAIIKEKFISITQIDDLSCYVKRLLDHRTDTIRVMQAIKAREGVMDKCNSLISLALRFFNARYSTLHDDIARNIQDSEGFDKEQELKEDIKNCVLKFQKVSCDVIRAIVSWRDALWRPQPFMYKGQNYLIKMRTDMNFLRSKSAQRILDSTSLEPRDLVCVLFKEDTNENGAVRGSNARFENGMMVHVSDDTPLRGGELEASLSIEDPNGTAIIEHAPTTKDGTVNENLTTPLLQPPPPGAPAIGVNNTSQPLSKEDGFLEDMVVIVTEELQVQQALKIEKSALNARGTFIPSLRFELDETSDANLLKEISR